SRAMIDAGADLVVGHGPHVLRAMEFYQGRLIAYSLGNFAGGGGALSGRGRLGWGGVLKVSLAADGSWQGGEFVSTYMNSAGRPTLDPDRRGLDLLGSLCRSDFPSTGARFDDEGAISPPSE
ncbi:MAG TPA: CapA family protein, partial [Micromonospora sp.]